MKQARYEEAKAMLEEMIEVIPQVSYSSYFIFISFLCGSFLFC